MYIINPLHIFYNSKLRIWSHRQKKILNISISKDLYELITAFIGKKNPITKDELKTNFVERHGLANVKFTKTLNKLIDLELIILFEEIKKYTSGVNTKYIDQQLIKNTLFKNPISYFIVAQELGYEVVFHDAFTVSVTHKNRTHWFQQQGVSSLIDQTSLSLVRNKYTCANLLKKYSIPVPQSLEIDLARTSSSQKSIKFPVVIKPLSGMASINVVCNIQNEKEFQDAIIHIKNHQKLEHINDQYLVEEYVDGETFRWLYGAEKVLSVIHTQRPYVVGNGKESIKTLVELKTGKKIHPSTNLKLLQQNKSENYVLNEKEVFIFTDTAGPSMRGVVKEVGKKMPESVNRMVKKICKLTHLKIAAVEGVVPVVNGEYNYEGIKFIDINPAPDLYAQFTDSESFTTQILKPLMVWLMTSPEAQPKIEVNFKFLEKQRRETAKMLFT